jgi:hypothetical protein
MAGYYPKIENGNNEGFKRTATFHDKQGAWRISANRCPKKLTSCSEAERDVLDCALEEYRPG